VKSIALICFGKLKTPGFETAVHDFTKRMSRFCDFKVYELKPLPVPDKSDSNRQKSLETECERVEALISSRAFEAEHGSHLSWVVLDETGKASPTQTWAKQLQHDWDSGKTPTFILGSGLGLAETLIRKADRVMAFGPQTLSHELARLVLVEQLYRASSLLAGHPYHNEG
jgi:23S rRNA (pseudouridine1915-N3)-methyltransferase